MYYTLTTTHHDMQRQAHLMDVLAKKTRASSAVQQLVDTAVQDIVLNYSGFQDDNGGVSESFQVLSI